MATRGVNVKPTFTSGSFGATLKSTRLRIPNVFLTSQLASHPGIYSPNNQIREVLDSTVLLSWKRLRKSLFLEYQNNYIMGAAQMREELHQFINNADERMLNLMYDMMKAGVQKDEALEASIDKGLEQSRTGKVRPHETVMAEIRARYKS